MHPHFPPADAETLRGLPPEELFNRTRHLAETERRISVEILHHLAEIDRRRAYAKLGYASLWDYVLKDLKYSESAAWRRISAMRALKAHPELKEKIHSGALSVSIVSQVQSFLQTEQNQAHRHYRTEQKAELFTKCENKSSREVTRELLSISPLALRVQKERLLTENRTLISFVADEDLLGKIRRVRDLSVARLQDPASYPELVNLMSEVTLDKIDPCRRPLRETQPARGSKPAAGNSSARGSAPAAKPIPDQNVALITSQPTDSLGNSDTLRSPPSPQPRAVPQSLRTRIWKEYDGRCAFISEETGRRCNSTFGLEIEHCQPHALGGSSKDPANLRLLCKHHNQWQAIQTYGLDKMEPFLKTN